MRKFLSERPDDQQNLVLIKQLRTNKPFAPYARRSDPTAKDATRDRTQSREMQTDDFILWGKRKGWPEHLIYPYFADLGLSGTLPPDQRPDMLRLFEDLDSGKLDGGTIGCWQENRPFRDETHIYYNQLIEKILLHDVVLVVLSPRLYIYDMRDPFDKERLRDKFKEAANYIPVHIKGWLHPAKERAAWEDDEWAGMGDLPPGFIVDYNKDSPTYKHAIPYPPHLEKVREHFELYRELGGINSLYYQHLNRFPIVFPEFLPEIDQRIVSKFKLSRYPGGGYYIKSKNSLLTMLANPLYGGYRAVKGVIRRDSEGNKIRSFPPVIEDELREFAFYRIARTDLDGNPIEGNTVKQYFHMDNDAEIGLLKFRIKSDQGEARLHWGITRKGVYRIQILADGYVRQQNSVAEVSCNDVDTLVVNRLFEHVAELLAQNGDLQAYEANVQSVRSNRLAAIKQVEASIVDIDKSQSGLTRNVGRVEMEIEEAKAKNDQATLEIKEKRRQLLEQEIENLEMERRRLAQTKAQLEEDLENDIGGLEEEMIKLQQGWQDYNFKKRRSLLNFAIVEVKVNKMSAHWMELIVTWLNEEWGTEKMYFRRKYSSAREWTLEEKTIVAEHYATMPILELMRLVPDRSLWSIRTFVSQNLQIKRRSPQRNGVLDPHISYNDMQFAQNKGIPIDVRYTNWECLSRM